MEVNIRKKRQIEKATEFAKKIKKVQKKTGVVLRNTQNK